MEWWDKMKDKARDGLRSFLEIQEPITRSYNIWGDLDFNGNAIKNRLWYRGDANELEQFWKETPRDADRHRFWSAVPIVGREIEKIHVGLPSLIVDMLTDIVITDLQQINAGEGAPAEAWEEIADENNLYHLLTDACRDALVIGDGAFKISLDSEISKLPIIEFWDGEHVEFKYKRGRLVAVKFYSVWNDYTLVEKYEKGKISAKLKKGNEEYTPAQLGMEFDEITWDGDYMLAVPLKFFPSKKYEGRGGSIFDAKSENFDALDEAWSQWVDALRKARTKEYIPESLLPRNPETGEVIKPSAFDNSYYKTEGTMAEGVANKIEVVQPDIRHDGYLATYVNALDLCLMGLISPSTLGIDVKKLDNAEAQREKEKATLYTRNKMITVLQEVLPKLVEACVNAWQTSNGMPLSDVDANIEFGEYANPSFESVVETVGKAKMQGIMSIEACVEELYGDTRDNEWKAEEVARLKAEQGQMSVEAPTVGITWEDLIASSSEQQPVRNDSGAGDETLGDSQGTSA